jgi:hypothetical protein
MNAPLDHHAFLLRGSDGLAQSWPLHLLEAVLDDLERHQNRLREADMLADDAAALMDKLVALFERDMEGFREANKY